MKGQVIRLKDLFPESQIIDLKEKLLQIPHAVMTDGITNIPLEKNPNSQDKRIAYVKPKSDKANKSIFGKRLDSWHLTDKDIETVNNIIAENAKIKSPKKTIKKERWVSEHSHLTAQPKLISETPFIPL